MRNVRTPWGGFFLTHTVHRRNPVCRCHCGTLLIGWVYSTG